MRWLVTGGAGFVGSAFVRAALRAGAEVISLDKLTYAGSLDNLDEVMEAPGHVFQPGDIGDADLLERLFGEHAPDAVVNLAAETHVDRSIDSARPFVETNVLGLGALLDATTRHWRSLGKADRAAFRFLQVSTDEVFGALGEEGAFDEESPFRPRSPYAASKAAGDHLVQAFHHTHGLPTLATHSGNNLGPRQFPEKLLPLMILNAREGRPLPLYGDGRQVRDWIHVEDHASALIRVLARGRVGERYLIGARRELRNVDLIRRLTEILDEMLPNSSHRPHARLIEFVADRPGHDRRYGVDPSKLERETGWRARVDMEDGLRRTVTWYLENEDWCRRARARYDGARLGMASAERAS